MKVRYTDIAIDEIEDIFSYIARDNPSAAARVTAEIQSTIEMIAEHPKIGPVKYRGIVRMMPVRRFRQYLVF